MNARIVFFLECIFSLFNLGDFFCLIFFFYVEYFVFEICVYDQPPFFVQNCANDQPSFFVAFFFLTNCVFAKEYI